MFLSTLSLRRATDDLQVPESVSKVSIHALLAESDPRGQLPTPEPPSFYPRSPCGERPSSLDSILDGVNVSIHALLAESDVGRSRIIKILRQFLSTLSLRRATPSTTRRLTNLMVSIHALLAESDKRL